MATSLGFERVPDKVQAGTSLSGILVVANDHPIPMSKLSLVLRGGEEVIVAGAKGGNVPWRSDSLETPYRFFALGTLASEQVLDPGTHRIPFAFSIPPGLSPTLQTTPRGVDRGYWGSSDEQGVFVEYSLDARVEVPLGRDIHERVGIVVTRSIPILGVFLSATNLSPAKELDLGLSLDTSEVTPGSTVRGTWRILNPKGKALIVSRTGVGRRIDIRHDPDRPWTGRYRVVPDYSVDIDVTALRDPAEGSFEIEIPPEAGNFPSQAGGLYRAQWVAYLSVETSGDKTWWGAPSHWLDVPLQPAPPESSPLQSEG
ncbi:MAG: hypothetical protein L3K23_09270 [Thermoplasmata archaeon]|nr:hypothetical protein [Thermoplasmata archaeon]